MFVYSSQIAIHSVAKLFVAKTTSQSLFQLNSISLLTLKDGLQNSLLFDVTLNFAGGSQGYLEFYLPVYSLNNFGVLDGDEYPCTVQTAITTYSSRTARCVAFRKTSSSLAHLKVLLVNLGAFGSGTTLRLTVDGITNPSGTLTGQIPVDLQLTYYDLQNSREYTHLLPALFVVDGTLANSAATVTRDLAATSTSYGAAVRQEVTVQWPASTSSSDSSAKVLLELQGGLLCCVPFSSLSITDSQGNSYSLLWANPAKNMLMLQAPSQAATTLTLRVNNVLNPYPYQSSSYTNSNIFLYKLTVVKDYQQQLIQTGSQPTFASYTINGGGVAFSSLSNYRLTSGFNILPSYPHHQQLVLSLTPATFATRKISRAVFTFTSGISSIKHCRIITSSFPSPKVACSASKSGSQWALSIGGLQDSTTASTVTLLLRMAVSSNSLPYTLLVYEETGLLEFQSSGTTSVSSYTTGRTFDSSLSLYSMKAVDQNYELARKELIPASGLTSRSLDI